MIGYIVYREGVNDDFEDIGEMDKVFLQEENAISYITDMNKLSKKLKKDPHYIEYHEMVSTGNTITSRGVILENMLETKYPSYPKPYMIYMWTYGDIEIGDYQKVFRNNRIEMIKDFE
jgi:hypothetical protein